MAFYDADLFESLRKLIYQSTRDPTYLQQLDMTFEIVDNGKTGQNRQCDRKLVYYEPQRHNFRLVRLMMKFFMTHNDVITDKKLKFCFLDNKHVELIQGGASCSVNNENIYDYVRRYAMYKMVTKPAPAIKEIRSGVHDVISEGSLNGLTPEDWWLLGMIRK